MFVIVIKITGVSLAEALELGKASEGLVGFLLLSFITGATYLGAVILAATFFLGFPANRYTVLFLAALHTSHLIGISLKDENQASVVAVNMEARATIVT